MGYQKFQQYKTSDPGIAGAADVHWSNSPISVLETGSITGKRPVSHQQLFPFPVAMFLPLRRYGDRVSGTDEYYCLHLEYLSLFSSFTYPLYSFNFFTGLF